MALCNGIQLQTRHYKINRQDKLNLKCQTPTVCQNRQSAPRPCPLPAHCGMSAYQLQRSPDLFQDFWNDLGSFLEWMSMNCVALVK